MRLHFEPARCIEARIRNRGAEHRPLVLAAGRLRRLAAVAAVGGLLAAASADQWVWTNVNRLPDDLIGTGDAWTAIRVEHPDFTSYRIAADDFELTEATRIERITHWTVKFENPIVVAGDWYIFAGGDQPGALIAAGPDTALVHEETGWLNPNFGDPPRMIWRNEVRPTDLVLPPGHYFLAFRTLVEWTGDKHSSLTTRWANGRTRAFWNFGVLTDGTVADDWVLMEIFNNVRDQEWAFMIEGQTLGGCDPCDMNCDGAVNANDIQGFIDRLFSDADPCCGSRGEANHSGDTNGDGVVDANDIAGFIDCLFG